MKSSILATLLAAAPRALAAAPSASGTKFTIDGQTKYFAGSNSYWISFLTNNADIDLAMSHIGSSGMKILRVWGFNDVSTAPSGGVWFHQVSASGSRINTGTNGLGRLDAVVAAAEKYNVKLLIPFVNNWDDYGGMNVYVRAFGGSKEGWYTSSRAQAQYQTYIKEVVSRYKNSSAIFAWELANEPRCKGCNTDVIYKWADATSRYVKSLDPDHMVTLGDEGMGLPGGSGYAYQYGEGTDFVKNLGIKTLDFGVFHFYPQSWGMSYTDGPAWVKSHADACVKAGKPCMFEEYGTPNNHCSLQKPWQSASRTTNGMASDLFWQWGDTLSSGRTHNDGNTIYYGSSDFQCLVTDHVKAIG